MLLRRYPQTVAALVLSLLTVTATLLGHGTTEAPSAPTKPQSSAEQAPGSASVSASRTHRRVGGTTARYARAINTRSRSAVENAYKGLYLPTVDVRTGATASPSGCVRGTSSPAYQSAMLRAINFHRSLAGLAPVRLTGSLNARAQAAALIMDANGALNHTPPSNWRCWTATGRAAASRSNLALGFNTAGATVDAYMEDFGGGNEAVGHRRWILNPFATTFGVGASGWANAMYVIAGRNSHRANPPFVAWPSAGYFPATLEPMRRWSLSAGNSATQFAHARVAVYDNGVRVPVTKYRVHSGYAQPTLVWQMPVVHATDAYTIKVTGIRVGHKTRSHTYMVRMFDPSN